MSKTKNRKGHIKEVPSVIVLLPVYNGCRFLEEQINSILNQVSVGVKILAFDDASSDESLNVLNKISKNDKRLKVYNRYENLGLNKTISALLKLAESESGDYFAMSDQDDLWDSDKLNESVIKLENDSAKIVYSNVRLINKEGVVIKENYFLDFRINPVEGSDPLPFVFRNPSIGHTMVLRREMIPIIKKIPDFLPVHEIWFLGVSAKLGKITFIDRPLGSYRQHSDNIIGAKFKPFDRIVNFHSLKSHIKIRQRNRYAALKALSLIDSKYNKMANLMGLDLKHRFLGLKHFTFELLPIAKTIGLMPCFVELVLYLLYGARYK